MKKPNRSIATRKSSTTTTTKKESGFLYKKPPKRTKVHPSPKTTKVHPFPRTTTTTRKKMQTKTVPQTTVQKATRFVEGLLEEPKSSARQGQGRLPPLPTATTTTEQILVLRHHLLFLRHQHSHQATDSATISPVIQPLYTTPTRPSFNPFNSSSHKLQTQVPVRLQ